MKRRLAIKQRLIQKRKELAQHCHEVTSGETGNGKRTGKESTVGIKQELDHAND